MTEQSTAPNGILPDQKVAVLNPGTERMYGLIDSIGFSPDPEVRAKDISKWLVNDLIAATTLLHKELAPEADQNPAEDATLLLSPPPNSEGELTITSMMEPEGRFALFEHTSQKIRELGQNLQPGQEKGFLDRAANMVGMTIVLTHTFEDGNGRTARVLSYLIKEGYDPENPQNTESIELGARNRPEKGFRMAGIIPKDKAMSPHELIDELAAADLSFSDRKAYLERSITLQTSPLNYEITE